MNNTFNKSYVGTRNDVLQLLPGKMDKVLDVGCSTGEIGLSIKENCNAEVFGIEISEDMASVAATRLDNVIVADVEKVFQNGILGDDIFDLIIFADILEHLKDPWFVLNKATEYLSENGIIIASIPNVRHISTIYSLLFKNYWPYRGRGIHDKTHLRFFTYNNIVELFNGAGLQIEIIKSNYRIIESPHRYNKYAKLLAVPGLKSLLTFQYLIRAKKL